MAKTSTAPASPQASGSALKRFFTKFTWYELLAIPAVGIGVAIYWYREIILDSFLKAQEATSLVLGIGFIPLLIWLGALTAAFIFKRSLFQHPRLWLASIPVLIIILGALSFFRPFSGALAWFTLEGYVSLGGFTGEIIAGSSIWQTALRFSALAAIAIAIAAPAYSLLFAIIVGKMLINIYIVLVLALKGIGGIFKRRSKPEDFTTTDDIEDDPTASFSDVLSEYSDDTRPHTTDAASAAERPASFTASSIREPANSHRRSPIYAVNPSGYTIEDVITQTNHADEPDDAPEPYDTHTLLYTNGVSETTIPNDHQAHDPLPHTNGSSAHEALYDHPDFTQHISDSDEDYDPPAEDMDDDDPTGAIDQSQDDHDHTPYINGASPDEPLSQLNVVDTNAAPTTQHTNPQSKSKISGLIPHLGNRREVWASPPIEMLNSVEDRGIPEDQIRETAETIRQTLADYGIEVEIGSIKYGPTVTMYGIIPGWIRKYKQVKLRDELGNPICDDKGKQITTTQEQKMRVKVDTILSREKDLSLALKTPNLRLETPVMGKAQVGIEIPNQQASPVTLRSIMESPEYRKIRKSADLPVALGKGTGGENIAIDLAKMPHLLIAGATGSGKSVALNTIISGLLMERSPADLRMLLIDPKRVELTPYNGIPHLLCPVVVEVDEVVGMLKGVINEMMDRYRRMEEIGVRNIEMYNQRMPESKMPFLLIVVDELADLMMTAAFDVEQSLCRLAQLARATGIHLILATQRPSVNVVTGLIKANFPSRISFGVTSHIDSRTILDSNGAEKLLGKGDMLYLPRDAARPMRAQGAFISDQEIDNLINFWQTTPKAWLPEVILRPVSDDDGESHDLDDDAIPSSGDALFDKAIELAYTQKTLSTSLLQRRLRIGYPRAARLMDQLEDQGIVGPSDGSKSRDVIITHA